MKSRITAILIYFLCFNALHAQEEFDLTECLVYTLQNSPKIASEKLAQEKETVTLFQNKSSYLPQVDAFINYHNYFSDLPTYIFPETEGSNLAGIPTGGPYPVQLGLPHNLNTGFEINQTIFDMNFFGNGELSEHFQAYNDIKLTIAEEEILYQVAVLYYQVAINEEKMLFLEMNLERLIKIQDIVKLQVDQGFAKQTDFDKLAVKTSTLKSKKNKLAAGIRQQISYLKFMMGMPGDDEIDIVYEKNMYSPAGLLEENSEDLEEKLLNEQRKLNRMNTRKLNAEYYPKLQAYAAFLFQAQRQQLNFLASGQDWYNIHQWGLKLTIPIMRGFEKKSKKELSEIVDAQLTFGLDQKKQQSEIAFSSAVSELEASRIEQEAQKENVALAERIFKQSELSYEEGTILLMDFMDTEAMLRESQMMYATSILDTKLAELKILKASGKLKELINQ